MDQLNPYSSPQAATLDAADNALDSVIDALEVSDKWKEKFRAIALAGGPSLPDLKKLPRHKRRKAFSFNVLAFLFGPIYYIAKGMWKKGLAIFFIALVLIVVLGVILDYFGLGKVADLLGYAVSAVYALRANIDYYKKMVLRDNGWI